MKDMLENLFHKPKVLFMLMVICLSPFIRIIRACPDPDCSAEAAAAAAADAAADAAHNALVIAAANYSAAVAEEAAAANALRAAELAHDAASAYYLYIYGKWILGKATFWDVLIALAFLRAAAAFLNNAVNDMNAAVANTLAALSAYTAALNAWNAAQAAAIAAQQALAECMAEED